MDAIKYNNLKLTENKTQAMFTGNGSKINYWQRNQFQLRVDGEKI